MRLTTVTPPALEPVTLAELKLHIRVDHDHDDSYLLGLSVAARRIVEKRTKRAFVTQTLRQSISKAPQARRLDLARGPVQSVSFVRTIDAYGVVATLPTENFIEDFHESRPGLSLAPGASWPVLREAPGGLEVEFTAGYGASGESAPQELRHAVLLLSAHYYEWRELVSENRLRDIPDTIERFLAPYTEIKL